MADVTSALVKELREKTGAGMMDCKRALTETSGDMEAAVDWLRKKGLAAAAKKSARIAAEGLIAVASDGNRGAMIELNAETDFVARNETFQQAALAIAGRALEVGGTVEAIKGSPFPGSERTVDGELTHLIATIGENMNLRRAISLSVEHGVVATYVHSALVPNAGKIGVLVALESTADASQLLALGRQIAMHVAAARPEALTIDDVDPANLERERNVLTEQALSSGRPENVIAKMVEGRIRKYYEEVVLLEQLFVIDGKTKVSQVVADAGKQMGTPVAIKAFARFQLGEGIEREATDFAAEVAQLAN